MSTTGVDRPGRRRQGSRVGPPTTWWRRCRGIFGQRRVGHAGTLDPDATGRAARRVGKGDAALAFPDGPAQDLYDRDRARDRHVDPRCLRRGPETFDMTAVTPEAVRRQPRRSPVRSNRSRPWSRRSRSGGRRLHELARQGIEVERAARPVTVYRLRRRARSGAAWRLRAEIECSSGTYIRVLAEDLGAALGGGRPCGQPAPDARSARSAATRCGPSTARTRRRAHAGRGHARSRAGAGRRSQRRRHPDRVAAGQGAARGDRRRPVGDARREWRAPGRLRGDRDRPIRPAVVLAGG